jgi:hypothetical protein
MYGTALLPASNEVASAEPVFWYMRRGRSTPVMAEPVRETVRAAQNLLKD